MYLATHIIGEIPRQRRCPLQVHNSGCSGIRPRELWWRVSRVILGPNCCRRPSIYYRQLSCQVPQRQVLMFSWEMQISPYMRSSCALIQVSISMNLGVPRTTASLIVGES